MHSLTQGVKLGGSALWPFIPDNGSCDYVNSAKLQKPMGRSLLPFLTASYYVCHCTNAKTVTSD